MRNKPYFGEWVRVIRGRITHENSAGSCVRLFQMTRAAR